ncbi:WXG100 family type VII secretion target [Psychromicrobium xiongbiense]|uniref:WXG100 family type VII secretion target n=1 Tax=Psychromicrobium xiongbiense TaxID=3051184 RepID=UPI0025524667|nr:WXG100 family type VII secretion target [Psychromicrobium sp. YIM S02556]
MNVTFDELDNAAKSLESGKADLESKLGELQKQIQALVTSGYVTDKSSKAYEAEYHQFTQGAQQAVSGLDGLSHYLHHAADTLRSTDEQLATQLGK